MLPVENTAGAFGPNGSAQSMQMWLGTDGFACALAAVQIAARRNQCLRVCIFTAITSSGVGALAKRYPSASSTGTWTTNNSWFIPIVYIREADRVCFDGQYALVETYGLSVRAYAAQIPVTRSQNKANWCRNSGSPENVRFWDGRIPGEVRGKRQREQDVHLCRNPSHNQSSNMVAGPLTCGTLPS